MIRSSLIRIVGFMLAAVPLAQALERPGVEFKIFQFPPDQIPRICDLIEGLPEAVAALKRKLRKALDPLAW